MKNPLMRSHFSIRRTYEVDIQDKPLCRDKTVPSLKRETAVAEINPDRKTLSENRGKHILGELRRIPAISLLGQHVLRKSPPIRVSKISDEWYRSNKKWFFCRDN